MNIIEFIEHPQFINDKSLSLAQRVTFKTMYGLPLTGEEQAMHRRISSLTEYAPKEWPETTILVGRQAGKSSRLATYPALFEACARDHHLSIGQKGVVMVVASELKRQAKIVYGYILGRLEGSPILRRMIERTTTDEIELNNGISIQVYPCNVARIRGASLVCFIGDEAAFWKSDGKNIDKDVLDAARPGLIFEHSKMIKISTPYAMRGEIYQDYKHHFGKADAEVLVIQGDTPTFNPSYSSKKLDVLKRRDPVAYETEIMAKFRADISSMYDPAVIDAAINFDRPAELPYRQDARYSAFVDVAGGGGKDSYAVAIGHKEGEKIIVDVVRSRAPKFNPEEVTRQFSELFKLYGITSATGDKFSGDFALNIFAKYGVSYERAEKPKSELYLEAEGVFNTGGAELPNREIVLSQFKNLVRKTRTGGRDSVDTDAGQPEDEANVVAGLIELFSDRAGGAGFWLSEYSCYPDPNPRSLQDMPGWNVMNWGK